jgi:hypothetical protein
MLVLSLWRVDWVLHCFWDHLQQLRRSPHSFIVLPSHSWITFYALRFSNLLHNIKSSFFAICITTPHLNNTMGQILSSQVSPPAKFSSEKVSDTYLAKPSGACCLKGTLHNGESRGSWETITGVETYITTPPKNKSNGHVLLYFPDVWGMFPNGLLVMDAFADAGYTVLGLDYFRGVRFISMKLRRVCC